MGKQSRLDEIAEKRSIRYTIFIIGGIIALILGFFFYGVPMIVNLSILAGKLGGDKDIDLSTVSSSYIAPPVLDPIKDATNSAKVTISGSALPNQEIRLYVNGEFIDQISVKDNKIFVFKDVILEPGDNDLKVKAIVADKESDYSQILRIVYINKAPSLEITSPLDNQNISNGDGQVKVEGRTDSWVRVVINGYWAIVDSDGTFSYLLHLQKGDNNITVEAMDAAGNKTEKQLKVKLE